jgi:dipeptidyl aminopeptidase/acylaminoacyl peptidase
MVDSNRMGVMGWSYGGYMTSWIITQTNRFRAASPGAAVTDLYSFFGTADIPPFLPQYFGGFPWDEQAAYLKHSPMFNVKGVTTPTLILHGISDVRVPLSQGEELYEALKAQNIPVQMVKYPRQGHGFNEPRFQRDCAYRLVNWFNEHVRGEKTNFQPPAGDEEKEQ